MHTLVDRNNYTYMEVCANCVAPLIRSFERRLRYLHVWSKQCPAILCVLERKDTSIAVCLLSRSIYSMCVVSVVGFKASIVENIGDWR